MLFEVTDLFFGVAARILLKNKHNLHIHPEYLDGFEPGEWETLLAPYSSSRAR